MITQGFSPPANAVEFLAQLVVRPLAPLPVWRLRLLRDAEVKAEVGERVIAVASFGQVLTRSRDTPRRRRLYRGAEVAAEVGEHVIVVAVLSHVRLNSTDIEHAA